tara:strand:+ start:550 stop:783 length:234 start_codon:yes stop_codon:yes gene_type:complete
MAAACNMMGVSHRRISKLDSALISYNKAMNLFTLVKSNENVRRVNNNRSTLYTVQKQYYKSISIKLKNLKLLQEARK